MQLATPKIIVRFRRGERLHHPRFGEVDPKEPDALVPIGVLRDEYRSTVRGPGDDCRVALYGLREAEGRLRAIGRCGEHVSGRPET